MKKILCPMLVALAVCLKLWLVFGTEIADATDDPHEYVLQILYPVNGGLAYAPGTGIFGRLFHDIGMPFRLGIEAVFAIACTLVLRALFDWPWRAWRPAVLFAIMILDPLTLALFSHLYSDQVWLVETMLGAACFIFGLRNDLRPGWGWLGLAALFLGLSAITRSVGDSPHRRHRWLDGIGDDCDSAFQAKPEESHANPARGLDAVAWRRNDLRRDVPL